MRAILLALLLSFGHLAMAADEPTIYDSSVNWDDIAARNKILESSKTPEWDASSIVSVYDMYTHPKEHKLPSSKDDQKFNTAFIDEFWGPIANPFVKYARPAKAFVYLGQDKVSASFMAPIVKSATDGNYYVFNRNSSKPQLLEEWINEIKSKALGGSVKFDICNGYGNLPADTCAGKCYQAEENFALNSGVGEPDGLLKADARIKSASAYRAEGEDWHKRAENNKTLFGAGNGSGSIYQKSIKWNDVEKRNELLQTTSPWANYQTIQGNFEKLRDLRYFDDTQKHGFSRRISWLYPDDGCWTRASAVINHLFGADGNVANQFVRPSKVFAFGNLCANTPNHKSGKVNWWYHTAPLIRDAQTNQVYVLDPSIDAKKPMTVESWMETISAKTGACKNSKASVDTFNVCTGFGASPHDVCKSEEGASFVSEATEALGQSNYQRLERSRQVQLERDADKVLGDEAPWM